jgi:hypothetical protein
VTCDWDCNKPINNLNGVFSGETRRIGDQKWSSNPNIVQYDNIEKIEMYGKFILCLQIKQKVIDISIMLPVSTRYYYIIVMFVSTQLDKLMVLFINTSIIDI